MRIVWRAWGLGALIVASLILSNGTLAAADTPLVHVNAVVQDGSVRLDIQANGPFEYTTSRPASNLYVIGLSGVASGDPPLIRMVASDLIMRYRLISYSAGGKPVVDVEILLKKGLEPRLERRGNQDLSLLVSRSEDASSPAAQPMASPAAAAMVPAASKSSQDLNLTASRTPEPISSTRPMPTPAAPAIVRPVTKPVDVDNLGAGAGNIQQVHLAQNGGATEVTISGSGPLKYHALHFQDPDRLVLDFAGSHLSTSENHIASGLGPVRQIRMGQFTPETSRIVIDLSQPARYGIKAEGNTVTVSLTTNAASANPSR